MRAIVTALFLLVAVAGAQDAPLPEQAWPGDDRAALAIPDAVWDRVLAATVPSRRALGYTGDEMRSYGGREHLLRTVENLFRDARAIPRETGRITDDLLALAEAGKVDEVVQRCWSLLDMPAGRNFPAVPRESWGVPWIPAGASAAEAFAALAKAPGSTTAPPADDEIARFGALPAPVQRLVVRISVGALLATAWLGAQPALTEDVARPWTDEEFGQSATSAHLVFGLLRDFDASRMAYASVIFAAHLKTALDEWREAGATDMPEGRWTFGTPLGPVLVFGRGDDEIAAGAGWLIVDLGGNDLWTGSAAASTRGTGPVSVAIDLGGDDTWNGGDAPFALGCGLGGIGALVDLHGNDRYTVEESGLGCGWFGTGILFDFTGDDHYVVNRRWGEGAAHAGVGILLDWSGSDRYECAEQSQGMGSTLGCGLLLDLKGNDVYWCRDDGNVSELYLNQSVAMAQGCGYGRRADLGDGRSLAGGFGLLVDGAGNDRYHAQCWSQGCGYWWGVGVLEDRAGDDVYENGKYSLGAGAHFAIGVHVDLAGDDRYNEGIPTTKNQFQGHARDGSIGISIDGSGNDRYFVKNLCAGSADLGSIALFWDRRGDDRYEARMEEGLGDTAPFGSATIYPPMRSFRDDLPAVGIFLDTGGSDTYAGDPRGGAGGRDAAAWTERRGPISLGFGLDAPLYR